MKKIITEYINRTEAQLSVNPQNKLLKSYLLKLKSLKDLPDAYLNGFDEVIPCVYEDLKNLASETQNKAVFKIFSAMVENTRIAVMLKNES